MSIQSEIDDRTKCAVEILDMIVKTGISLVSDTVLDNMILLVLSDYLGDNGIRAFELSALFMEMAYRQTKASRHA